MNCERCATFGFTIRATHAVPDDEEGQHLYCATCIAEYPHLLAGYLTLDLEPDAWKKA